MKKALKPAYSVAMSKDMGSIVMVRTNGKKVAVMGSLTREESLKFAEGIQSWVPESVRPDASRAVYPH